MAEAEELDVELFIDEVRKTPMLWNVNDEEYHHRTKKRNAWMGICRLFCDGFDIQSDRFKDEMCKYKVGILFDENVQWNMGVNINLL